MGQYFIAVNCTKKEYFSAQDRGDFAKLWGWCANPQATVSAYLLRKSNESGGGYIINPEEAQYAGRWTSGEIFLDGDYESNELCQKAKAEYTNITKGLVEEYVKFIGISDLKLSHQDK